MLKKRLPMKKISAEAVARIASVEAVASSFSKSTGRPDFTTGVPLDFYRTETVVS